MRFVTAPLAVMGSPACHPATPAGTPVKKAVGRMDPGVTLMTLSVLEISDIDHNSSAQRLLSVVDAGREAG